MGQELVKGRWYFYNPKGKQELVGPFAYEYQAIAAGGKALIKQEKN